MDKFEIGDVVKYRTENVYGRVVAINDDYELCRVYWFDTKQKSFHHQENLSKQHHSDIATLIFG